MSEERMKPYSVGSELEVVHLQGGSLVAALALRAPAHIEVRGSVSEVTYVLADGQKEKARFAEILNAEAVVEERNISLHASMLVGGNFRAGRIERAEAVDAILRIRSLASPGVMGTSKPKGSQPSQPPRSLAEALVSSEPVPGDEELGWGAVAQASADSSREKIRTDAELTWAQVADASSEKAADPVRKPASVRPATPTASQKAGPRTLAGKRAALKKKRVRKEKAPTRSRVPVPEKTKAPPSRARSRNVDFLDDHYPDPGDFVEHRRFGKCRVIRIDDDGGALIELPDKKRKSIKLSVFQIGEPDLDSKSNLVYPLSPRRG